MTTVADPPRLLVEVSDGVATLTLNRPEERNAIDLELHDALERIWRELAADNSVRAVVLTGAGRAFSGGGNVGGFTRLIDDHDYRRMLMTRAMSLVDEMCRFAKPVVAAVNGAAVGLGSSLVGLCDIVLMGESAYLADTHVSVGIVAGDGAVATWPLFTGLLRAKELILLGERIDARTATELGLANRVVADADLQTAARDVAVRLAQQPAQAMEDTKRALNLHLQRSVREVLPFALAAETNSFLTPELRMTIERLAARGAGA